MNEEDRDAEQIRRFEIVGRIEKAEGLVSTYRTNIEYWRHRIDREHKRLGHIAERLGEPEPDMEES